MSDHKWLSTGYQKSKPLGAIDRDRGIITGALVVTEGEAKGHGVFLEAEFVEEVIAQGNATKAGLKARFGHPNMCSTALGTFLGRWRNFRRDTVTRDDGSQAFAARADLFLSNSAKDTPNGDLYDYVSNLAESESDVFGTSIVFTPGDGYWRSQSGVKVHRRYDCGADGRRMYDNDGCAIFAWVDETGKEHDPSRDPIVDREYASCDKLHACDCVDDPAANDGLFSKFSGETVAGQITEFLDLHPHVFTAISDNPSILESLAKYANRIDEFITRYREYRAHKQGEPMSNEAEPTVATPEAEAPAPEAVSTIEPTAEPVVEPTETPEPAEPEPVAEVNAEPAPAQASTEDASRKEFARMTEDFGAEIAATAFAAGGGYEQAKDAYVKALKAENEALKSRMESAPKGGSPASFSVSETKNEKDSKGVHRIFREGTRVRR